MRALSAFLFGVALASLLLACPPPPAPVPVPPDADAAPPALDAEHPRSEAARICLRLAALPSGQSCPEATVASCAAALDRAEGVTRTNRPCLLEAQSASAVRACGSFITCPQPGDLTVNVAPPAPSSSATRHR